MVVVVIEIVMQILDIRNVLVELIDTASLVPLHRIQLEYNTNFNIAMYLLSIPKHETCNHKDLMKVNIKHFLSVYW